jgi:TRAP-type C4-dicarboxylate transport system permease small subunit
VSLAPQGGPADLAAGTAPDLEAGRFGQLRRAAAIVSGLLFAAVFLVFVFKIVMRYASHDEPAWTDEVSVILFMWIVLWANAFVVRDREQIVFDLFYHPLPPRARRVVAIARALLIGGIFAVALPGSLDYIAFLWRERTPVLNLRLDWLYAIFGAFMIAVVVRSAWQIVRLVGPNWRRAL